MSVAAWKRRVADGTAAAYCDEVVRRRHAQAGVPMALADALLVAPVRPEPRIRTHERLTDEITEREHHVLLALADGLPNDEIAAELNVCCDTVKTHMKHLLGKLGARNRTHAVALAYHRGILTPHRKEAV